MRRALWPMAVALWVAGMILLVLPGDAAAAGVAFGDVTFSFGQVCILLSVAAAWGDSRARHMSHVEETRRRFEAADERIERIEKHLFKV